MCKPLTPWERCIQFHGHECKNLAIGYQAATYAKELLDISFSDNERVACISEIDACGVDAIQVVLGCSSGKGNLLFEITGEPAFSFYDTGSGKSVRLVLKTRSENSDSGGEVNAVLDAEPETLFDVTDTRFPLPKTAEEFGCFRKAGA